MHMRSGVRVSTLLAALLGAASASATPVIFTNEASFYAVMGGANLAVEGFDAGPFAVAPDALVFGDLAVNPASDEPASPGSFTLGFAAPIREMPIDVMPLLGVSLPGIEEAANARRP
jgi:hypothetical protein